MFFGSDSINVVVVSQMTPFPRLDLDFLNAAEAAAAAASNAQCKIKLEHKCINGSNSIRDFSFRIPTLSSPLPRSK